MHACARGFVQRPRDLPLALVAIHSSPGRVRRETRVHRVLLQVTSGGRVECRHKKTPTRTWQIGVFLELDQ